MSLFTWLAGRSAARGQAQAGTTLADYAQGEEARANAYPGQQNPFISESYSDQIRKLLETGELAAGGSEAAAQRGQGYLDPYMQAGSRSATTLADLVNAPEERFNFQFSQDDPSYQFRLGEGQKALERSAAARGTLLGGGTLKAITNYGQQAASQEYQSAYNRAMDAFKVNQTGRQQRMSSLADLARLGGTSAATAGQFGMTGAEQAGKFRTGAAQQAGQWGIDSANKQLAMNLYGTEWGRQARGQRAGATSASQMGRANTWADFWNAINDEAAQAAAAGFGGG